ncbi:MAG TPA: hypothetical protein VMB05_04325 [Solirubrobacteraceae bacterium]|nr:hypothetical protein [Solirubrobacteraceae bacterium]
MDTRICRVALAVLPILVSVALVASASAAKPKPPVSVHAIFDNGKKPPFRVGQVLQVNPTPGAKPGKITKVCFSPAPISRPSCGKSPEGAPSAAGTTKITVSFSKRASYTLKFKVLAAATKVGGEGEGLAVPATITCPSVSLYANAIGEAKKNEKPVATLTAGTKVALYNKLGPGGITMIDYETGALGTGEERCATPGI